MLNRKFIASSCYWIRGGGRKYHCVFTARQSGLYSQAGVYSCTDWVYWCTAGGRTDRVGSDESSQLIFSSLLVGSCQLNCPVVSGGEAKHAQHNSVTISATSSQAAKWNFYLFKWFKLFSLDTNQSRAKILSCTISKVDHGKWCDGSEVNHLSEVRYFPFSLMLYLVMINFSPVQTCVLWLICGCPPHRLSVSDISAIWKIFDKNWPMI